MGSLYVRPQFTDTAQESHQNRVGHLVFLHGLRSAMLSSAPLLRCEQELSRLWRPCREGLLWQGATLLQDTHTVAELRLCVE